MKVVVEASELCKNLFLENNPQQLCRRDGGQKLPGQPRIRLVGTGILSYLRQAHLTLELDRLAPHIRRLGLATPTSTHISPLHHQAARLRNVVPVENPRLHLVWYHDVIFIKPIPEYMFSSSFWTFLDSTDMNVWRACAGFMRTYYHLIQYQSDFKKATSSDLELIPAILEGKPVEFDRFMEFVEPFASLEDAQVNARYAYGELRLSRLNMLARIFLWKATYHHVHAQWSTFLGRFLTPFLALFAVLSTVLSAMQVGLAASAPMDWKSFCTVSKWFAVVVIVLAMLISIWYAIIVIFMLVTDFAFAKRLEHRKKSLKYQSETFQMKSGVV